MGVYDRQIARAKKNIKAKGQLVMWIQRAVDADTSQPWKTTDTDPQPAPIPVSIVFLAPKQKLSNELFHLMSGTSIPAGAPYGLMAAVPFTPKINDSVLRGTDNLLVKSIDVVAPNGDPILYKIQFDA